MRHGYTTISALPELTGKPHDHLATALISALRPSCVRVSSDGWVHCDAMTWRVTVYLGPDKLIERIEQEVSVQLPDGVEHGYDLQRQLGLLKAGVAI